MPFLDSLDIANRALQLCGEAQIVTVTEDTKRNTEASFSYDKLRRTELRRNTWRFSIRHAVLRPVDTDTMLLAPTTYSATATYLPGAIVADSNGQLWTSDEPDNVNNTPGDTDVWEMYFGPLAASLWSAETTYFSGEIVYVPGAVAGAYTIYRSLINSNDDVPGTATAYDATETYRVNDVVSYSGSMWRSLIPVNIGVTPADGPLDFDIASTYAAADTVTGSDDFIYSSVGNGNVGHDPVTDGGSHWTNTGVANAWSRSPTIPTSSLNWRVIAGTLKNLRFSYPIGTGPSSQSSSRNVFRLPAGFLRKAAQDPKAGSTSYLGAPSGRAYEDWDFEGDYLVSTDTNAIMLRFVADVVTVSQFDDMFCEGLACRIATGICETLTQSTTKLSSIASQYKLFMGEARTVNAIEIGAEEPPEDDYIACRA